MDATWNGLVQVLSLWLLGLLILRWCGVDA